MTKQPSKIIYRGYCITYERKPIPTSAHDWEFSHEDYDGPEDKRNGTGGSVADCQDQIDDQIDSA